MPEEVKKSLVGDLAGLSEPLKKLFEVVSSGVGRLTGAMWLDKRDADNEAYKILKVGGAQTQVAVDRMKAVGAIGSGIIPQVQKLTLAGNEVNAELSDGQRAVVAFKERSDNKAEYQNLLHQLNTEQTISFAAEELAQEGKTVSDEPIDDNWKARYFSIIQDISGEEMQLLWGKILAGEITKPNSFSLRTLDVLRNLTQQEALIFAKICNYLIVNQGTKGRHYSILRKKGNSSILGDVGYNDIILLQECGLLKPVDNPSFKIKPTDGTLNIAWQIADKLLMLRGENVDDFAITIQLYLLTKAGAEISNLIDKKASDAYISKICEVFKNQKIHASYAEFSDWNEEGFPSYVGKITDLELD